MAQIVRYYQDNVVYEDGPFVVCDLNTGGWSGWRLQVEVKGLPHPVVPEDSIFDLVESRYGCRYMLKSNDRERIVEMCDYMNSLVKDGKIVLDGSWWVHKP